MANVCACGCGQKPARWDAKYMRGHRPPETTEQRARRFWSKVAMTQHGCWLWQATTMIDGYGQFGVDGRVELAHRVAYELLAGPIPDGLYVCHRCDTPSCVRPSHLFLGTPQDNVDDMHAKGRATKAAGERSGNARLTDDQVVEIRTRRADGETTYALAAEFGITPQYVGQLAAGTWRQSA